MKLANRIAPTRSNGEAAPDTDPRENASAEVIDLASRTAYPAVAGRKGRSDAVGLAAGIGFVALLGAATLWGLNASRVPDSSQGAAPVVQNGPAPNAFIPPATAPVPVLNGQPAGAPAPSPVFSAPPQTSPVPMGNPYASPTVVFDAGALPAQAAGPLAGTPAGEAAAAATGTGAADFASRVGGVGGGPAVARTDVDPRTTVTQGTMIPAVLETAINTDVPGFARAVVSQDVRSFDGTRILVPRSSRLIGQYQSGLQAGQRRAYVIWTRLIRPDGVSVALASPASAFDGSGGLPGKVDSHFFQRFGSSI
uniref:TrbI/VirB10 family protein n=1 Tax=Croceibacterium ferulae TaxID=1854641 RepID=UPI000EB565F3